MNPLRDHLFVLIIAVCHIAHAVEGIDEIPVKEPTAMMRPKQDYLIHPESYVAAVTRSADGSQITLENGLIRRIWRSQPNGACVAFDNLMTGQTMLRAVKPEARVTINGKSFDVGGLIGQPNLAFLTPAWLEQMSQNQEAMQLVSVKVEKPEERLKWNRRRHHSTASVWPPAGIHLQMDYVHPAIDRVVVSVHYEMYDGLPAISKRIDVHNQTNNVVAVDRFRGEELAVVEQANWVETRQGVPFPRPDYLHVETDFAFGGFTSGNANRHTVHWRSDPEYKTQVNYEMQTPCLLIVEPTYGPAQEVGPQEVFSGFHVFELVYDGADRERRGLADRRFYRTLAPWVTENPITHHFLSSKPEQVIEAIDKAADVGFEAVILSFGSGFNMENDDPEFLKRWTLVAQHADSKGIELGAYSLFSSRSIGGGNDVVSPEGQTPAFGKAPSATSTWGIDYFQKLRRFFDQTGFDQFENDGPYPGDVDVTPRPPYQKGELDSRWAQWKIVSGLYKHLRETGVYINQPDYYFLVGGSKTGMGYRETNWSLPRDQQVIHTRQNIYDGTWTKTPSMGWMHVPLSQYHGGGAAATIEPLHEHLDHYEQIMRSNLGMGVQAHYRGPRLFDTDETRSRVKSIVDWYKKYRDILESDLIHGRRADGQDLDWMLHVNPTLEIKGMLCVYNPLTEEVTRTLTVPLYFTGLTDQAEVSEADESKANYQLSRDYQIELPVKVSARAMQWYAIRYCDLDQGDR